MIPNRRAFVQGLLLAAAARGSSRAQGFAGLGIDAGGFSPVVRGRVLTFPADHGPHPQFRIEWWYLTANLHDRNGNSYGVQWTLFRQAMSPGAQAEGWDSRQIWMGHAALTSAAQHRFAERLARGGIGQAGVDAKPFHAWIDAWDMHGFETTSDHTIAPLAMTASGEDFGFDLNLAASRPLVLQGDQGYSQKSDHGQASYYYSQPFFEARGTIELDGSRIEVTGQAWMDREWSSQPLASDQKGWDWISLHLAGDEKLMLFRLRQSGGQNFFSANWIESSGRSNVLAARDMSMIPVAETSIGQHVVPTQWDIAVPGHGLKVKITPLNPQSWMATSIPYWEGPVIVQGSHAGVGYLEATGY